MLVEYRTARHAKISGLRRNPIWIPRIQRIRKKGRTKRTRAGVNGKPVQRLTPRYPMPAATITTPNQSGRDAAALHNPYRINGVIAAASRTPAVENVSPKPKETNQ